MAGRFPDGSQGGDITASTAEQQYRNKTLIFATHLWQGKNPVDTIAGATFTLSNGALADQPVDASTLLLTPTLQSSTLYKIAATNSSLISDVTDVGDASWAVHVDLVGPTAGGLFDVFGNWDTSGPSQGMRLRINEGNLVAEVSINGSMTSVALNNAIKPGQYASVMVLIQRESGEQGTLWLATQDMQASVPLTDTGTLTSTRPFTLGDMTGVAWLGEFMNVRLAFGDQLLSIVPQAACAAIATCVFWAQAYAHPDVAADCTDVVNAAYDTGLSVIAHGDTIQEVTDAMNRALELQQNIILVRENDSPPTFTLTSADFTIYPYFDNAAEATPGLLDSPVDGVFPVLSPLYRGNAGLSWTIEDLTGTPVTIIEAQVWFGLTLATSPVLFGFFGAVIETTNQTDILQVVINEFADFGDTVAPGTEFALVVSSTLFDRDLNGQGGLGQIASKGEEAS